MATTDMQAVAKPRTDWMEACLIPVIPGTSVHAGALTPLFFIVFHFSWVTFGLVLLSAIAVGVLSSMGRPVPWLVRRLASRLRRGRVEARPLFYRRRTQAARVWDDIPIEQLRA